MFKEVPVFYKCFYANFDQTMKSNTHDIQENRICPESLISMKKKIHNRILKTLNVY